MEVYSDDYHVIPFHLWLSNMVSLQELHWELNDTWHIQTVESNQWVNTRNTQAYKAWKEKCLKQGNGKLPKYGAIWFAHYPNLMIEVYPYTLTVSTLYPISPEKTLNVVEFFYYKDAIEWLIEAEEAAYMETVYEDDEIARRMERGRMALIEQQRKYTLSDDEIVGPYQEPMEIGTRHFHEWYQKVMS